MIRAQDRVELPAGVALAVDSLHDAVRDKAIPLNASARLIIAARTIGGMAEVLERTYGLGRDVAVADARSFAASLNDQWLLNVRPQRGVAAMAARWIVATLTLRAPARWPARREPIATDGRVRAVLSTARAVAPAAVSGALVVALVVATIDATAAIVAASLLAVGTVAHESGHALALTGVPAFVGRRGIRVRVVHRTLPRAREAFVAALGPLAGAATALVGLATALAFDASSAPVAGGAVCIHALGLTVLAPDGRRVCAAF